MISFDEAFKRVMDTPGDFGTETVCLKEVNGRILADNIYTDRNYPPFDRATKDGIAINYKAIDGGRTQFEIKGVIAAGTAAIQLSNPEHCMEIMTGAVVPFGADTVVMYEDIDIEHGKAHLKKQPQAGQNIHKEGSDEKKGAFVLKEGALITAAEVGVLATVGRPEILVKRLPRVAVISTGNELVEVSEDPLPYQIRRSNSYSLNAALSTEGITPVLLHLPDDPENIRLQLQKTIREMDVLLLSGGVSKGKFDFIPSALLELGVKKIFHGVKQRPGKPFWFGVHESSPSWVFSFPGNPVSTFVNYHVYFRNWLMTSLGRSLPQLNVFLREEIKIDGTLTRFLRVKTKLEQGRLMAALISSNGSGDLLSLASTDGFIQLAPRNQPYKPLEIVPFIESRPIL